MQWSKTNHLVITNVALFVSNSKDPSTIERYSDDEEEIDHPPIAENSDESGIYMSLQLTASSIVSIVRPDVVRLLVIQTLNIASLFRHQEVSQRKRIRGPALKSP